jgi:hypothetical protein
MHAGSVQEDGRGRLWLLRTSIIRRTIFRNIRNGETEDGRHARLNSIKIAAAQD